MKYVTTTSTFFVFFLTLTAIGCGGGATSSNAVNSNSGNAAAKPSTADSTTGGALAKQGTPPKADFTMTAEDLHKDYVAIFAKDPKGIVPKYENKNIQISGRIKTKYPVKTGIGTLQSVGMGSGNDLEASCDFDAETEESSKLQPGQTVTLQGVQTNNYNMSTPKLEKCFVIKGAQ